MSRKRAQRDKAIYSNEKIWYFVISFAKDGDESRDRSIATRQKFVCVFVVDNSMARATKKAIHFFGRKKGIKKLKLGETIHDYERIQINCRRSTKSEIVQTKAGLGIDGILEVI